MSDVSVIVEEGTEAVLVIVEEPRGIAGDGSGDALTSGTLDQFADVTQTAGRTLAITGNTTLAGGTYSGNVTGNNTGDQDLSAYATKAATLDQFADVTQSAGMSLAITGNTTLANGTHSGNNTGDQDLSPYATKAATLDQFADVTQSAGMTLAITGNTTLANGTHSGNNTGDQDLSGYAIIGHDHSGVYQPADAQLDSLAGLVPAGNETKVVGVNGSGTGFELVANSGGGGNGTGDALTTSTLDQFADVTQAAGKTLAITGNTTLANGTHSGNNTGDQDLSPYATKAATLDQFADVTQTAGMTLAITGNTTLGGGTLSGNASGNNTGDVTLAGHSYLTISGQQITAGNVSLSGNVTGVLPLANGGTGAALSDPGADRLAFWDDSAGNVAWLTLGTNLSITGTTLNANVTGGNGTLQMSIDNGTTAIPTGMLFPPIRVPWASTITSVTLEGGSGETGNITLDLYKATDETTIPTSGNKITASAPPTITSARYSTDSTLTGWTTALVAENRLWGNITANGGNFTKLMMTLRVTKT